MARSRRERQIGVRLPERTFQAIKAQAETLHLTIAEYVRLVLIRHEYPQQPIIDEIHALEIEGRAKRDPAVLLTLMSRALECIEAGEATLAREEAEEHASLRARYMLAMDALAALKEPTREAVDEMVRINSVTSRAVERLIRRGFIHEELGPTGRTEGRGRDVDPPASS